MQLLRFSATSNPEQHNLQPMNAAPEKPEQGLPVFVAEQLKQLIYSGELKPGERLNEAALALRMGTSRGPIREAFRLLESDGLLALHTNRGAMVTPFEKVPALISAMTWRLPMSMATSAAASSSSNCHETTSASSIGL